MKDLIKTWRKAGFTLRLFDLHTSDRRGKWILGYEFKDGRKVIFAGEDYGVSPCHSIDSLHSVYSLLGFLALGCGDVDPEYFASYTPAQVEWRDSNRQEELSNIVNDWEFRQDYRRSPKR